MNTPWTASLFLKINTLVGKWPVLDRAAIFFAHYALWICAIILLYTWWGYGIIVPLVAEFLVMSAVAFSFSYMVALWTSRPRPILQFPNTKVLIRTMGTWKSFPSDHAISAVLLAYAGWITFPGLIGMLFVIVSILIACSRVWVGVHYPRDILGGGAVGILVIFASKMFTFFPG
ncbi:MAG: hypothetical protein CO030_00905 [Candidatus Magasanikbacteria bacterium CG_4_9_14_0_2_um_filter_42_11]|uniref:Phosphatidic acid phosphatase type 2/haloperoxidase domain-containing protein n=1 Tax=Candidatus Magasanikbacteria bacterium CG_4_9_14_0_2_um_filter_42_11 TaxID=1974643 RepID=A0A2M8FAQ5_9BACT|nr:MAG: hypothetical protein COU34_05115 [Candidatus Magasanikbacteria bacterium CG10_big_fil_rev_8_21_14_0_10_43_9]PIY92864.1 MAG: hypothetical protein COY70_01010 [Candidatus Magasanikbacteria bacterium CG_4_10_14_0_8_um_filter_42_12]PJC52812.1 MAG: hypothetical protein CO030_00905 [Candidatus Magasanikbacteria bacterium CG_4_9_14_0_2_um_filter_42_11]